MIIYLKTKEEIEGFRHAGFEAARILKMLLKSVQADMTTIELDIIVRDECKKIGAKPTFLGYLDFPAAVCTSVNEILVHGIPNSKKLQINDFLSIDLGITIDGFIGDTAATIVVSHDCHSNFSLPNLIIDCKNALSEAIQKARPGNKLSDISRTVCNFAKKCGYSMPVQYGGHGVDRFFLHAHPFIPNDPQFIEEDVTLYPGMVLAIEPMFIDSKTSRVETMSDGWSVMAHGNTAHFEHTIAVTEDEPLILTEN